MKNFNQLINIGGGSYSTNKIKTIKSESMSRNRRAKKDGG